MFTAFKEGLVDKVKENYLKVQDYEGEADKIKRLIIKELSSGFIHPIDREELIRLILTNDDIATYLKAASRRAILVDPRLIDDEIKDYIIEISRRIVESVKKLEEAVLTLISKPSRSLELADEVERLEEEVDEIRIKALAKILEFCDKTKTSLCIITKDIVDSLENSEDRCEDAADVIRSIAILKT